MFKKAFQIVTTFGVLLAAYAGYVQVFAIIAAGARQPVPARAWNRAPTLTALEATKLAEEAFGRSHWSAGKELPVRYYNHERGYWMYAKTYKRLNDGKQMKFRPFALIWKGRDGKGLKTATSDEAIIDLDHPLGLVNQSGAATNVLHARLEGNVRLRDDKGTPMQPIDDLVIGPMPYVDYDEKALQITSVSDVVIQDRDMRITGYDLLIQLRPRDETTTPAGSAGSFDAKTAFIKKNVHIVLNDVGDSGILPGTAKPEQTQGNRTPLDVRCAGPMQVDLPKPKHRVLVGPPAPPQPTLVFFSRDVVVLRGREKQEPDQLDCDELRLELVPNAKPNAAKPAPAPGQADARSRPGQPAAGAAGAPAGSTATAEAGTDPATGAGTEMTLRRAHATGHAVWLQSKSQGTTARCNELIHKKLAPEQPDETYLRGDRTMKLWVEKVETVAEGPDKGKIKSVTTIRTIDATIFEDGKGNGNGNDNATIVARGPGIMETRPARDKPVERKALWQDHLIFQPKLGLDNQMLKEIVLIGRPEFIDLAQATDLDARDRIYVTLRPKAGPEARAEVANPPDKAAAGAAAAAPAEGAGGYEIQNLKALVDVHLNAPGQVLTAREVLDAVFTTPPPSSRPRAARGAAAAPAAGTPAPGTPAADPAGKTQPPAPAPKAEPKEPDMTITADRVWASILMKPEDADGPGQTQAQARPASTAPGNGNGNGKGEVQQVRLRGGVVYHQDPAAGKKQGTDVTGEALDLDNQGKGKMSFQVRQVDPFNTRPTAKLAPLARVVTEEMTIVGPKIGMDQATDYAWVEGDGTLTMITDRGLLTDKGLGESSRPGGDGPDNADADVDANANANAKAEAKAMGEEKGKAKGKGKGKAKAKAGSEAPKQPLTISWSGEQSMMKFFGSIPNPRGGPPVAKAEFHKNVRAVMTDAKLACKDRLDTYMDRVVVLARPRRTAGESEPAEAEPKPQIAWIDCLGKAEVISRKADPVTGLVQQKQQIEGDRITYDKNSGEFFVPGRGRVHLYNREGEANGSPEPGAPSTVRRPVTPTSNPPLPATNPRRAGDAMTARNGSQLPRARDAAAKAKGKARAKGARPAQLPLKLTLVSFEDSMKGRYMAGKEADTTEPRSATFLGDVQALNAPVDNENITFNFDHPPDGFMFLTSQQLDIRSVPTPGQPNAARSYLYASKDAQAKTHNETISADIITYDSEKELFYAYATVGHIVRVARQSSNSQPVSGGQSQALKYNRRTGESEFFQPLGPILFVDAKTGIRPGPAPKEKNKPLRPDRIGNPMRIPGRGLIERKGMTGK